LKIFFNYLKISLPRRKDYVKDELDGSFSIMREGTDSFDFNSDRKENAANIFGGLLFTYVGEFGYQVRKEKNRVNLILTQYLRFTKLSYTLTEKVLA
jgi:hypothetical protein